MAESKQKMAASSPETRDQSKRFVARITIRATDFEDSSVCLVVRRRPFTVLVPSHAITALEDGLAESIRIDGARQKGAEIIPCAVLERDHLSLVRFHGKAPPRLVPARIPRIPSSAVPGKRVTLIVSEGGTSNTKIGTLLETKLLGSQVTLRTDIPVVPGQSGSPLFVGRRLCGICMGRERDDRAVAVRLSHEGLRELRRLRHGWARSLLPVSACVASLALAAVSIPLAAGVLALALILLLIRSWTSFSLAGVEGPPNKPRPRGLYVHSITASNGHAFTLRRTWRRTFATCISWWTLFPSRVGGESDHIAVGTRNEEGTAAYIHLLDRKGRIRWKYTVPDGECVYNGDESFDGYHVYRVYAADLTGDGRSEIIVIFIHNNWYPCKLMVFALDGEILGEYWHPGFLRIAGVGYVGGNRVPLLVATGHNNRFRGSSPVNPQAVFAFRGAGLRGQGPPYTGHAPCGNELWYYLVPSTVEGAKIECAEILFTDCNGDGRNEIRVQTEDGRYYYLDVHGHVVRTDVGDNFLLRYGHGDLPDLQPVALRKNESDEAVAKVRLRVNRTP